MKSAEEIYDLYRERRETRRPAIARMEQIRTAYNGDLQVPMAELSAYERAAVPNLVAQGIDQTATRIASTIPNILYPTMKVGVKREEDNARNRRAANLGWWEQNNMELKLRRRARWLQGYACAPVCIRPSSVKNIPCWYVRDPLSTYPAPDPDPDSLTPENVIFAFPKSLAWVQHNYPLSNLKVRRRDSRDTRITLLEYMDAEQITLIALSTSINPDSVQIAPLSMGMFQDDAWINTQNLVTLESAVNLAGVCPAVSPSRITLDREQGQYDGIIGMYESQAMLFAMNFRAVAQDVWPDQYLMSQPGQQVQLVTQADGRAGKIGEISGGTIETIRAQPGYQVGELLRMLDRNQHVSAGIPLEFGGESPSNARTGRRGDSILSAVVDFPIQEAQTLLAKSLEAENRIAVAIDKAYYGDDKKSFYVSGWGVKSVVDYVPNKIFTTDQNRVYFPAAGVDANNLTVSLGQLVGTELMSRRTAMELHPFIDDAEEEDDRITAQSLKRSTLAAIEQQAAAGAIPPSDMARIEELVITGKMEVYEAIQTAQREAQERQAQQQPPGSPPTQPGLSQPGMGAEAGAAIPPVTPSAGNLAQVLGSLYPAQAAMK